MVKSKAYFSHFFCFFLVHNINETSSPMMNRKKYEFLVKSSAKTKLYVSLPKKV